MRKLATNKKRKAEVAGAPRAPKATVEDVKTALDKADLWPPLDDRKVASLLHELQTRPGRAREAAARELLGCIVIHIHKGWPVSARVAEWMRDALIRAVYLDESPAVAFGLAAGRGRQEDERAEFQRAACLHVLWCWGLSKTKAGEIVGEFFHKDSTIVIKSYYRKAKAWRIEGPTLDCSGLDENALARIDLSVNATAADFMGGRDVWVGFRSPAVNPTPSYRISDDFRKHVAKSGVFINMDSHSR